MFVIRRLLLIINAVGLYLGFEFVRLNPSLWWLLLIIFLPLITLTVFDFTKRQFNWRFGQFLLLPLLYFGASFVFLMFVESVGLYRVLAIFVGVTEYLWLEQVLNYHYFSGRYQPYTIESLSLYLSLLAVFFIASSFFASLVFLNFNIFIVLLVSFILWFVLSYQVFWSYKFPWPQAGWLVSINSIVMAETFLVLSFGPLSFYVNGLIVAVVYYLLTILSRDFLREELTRRRVLIYGFISVAIILILLITAQWS